MQKKNIYLNDIKETAAFAKELASTLRPEKTTILFLEGDLGSGKTTLTRFLLNALGWTGRVKSPTYTLIETYVFNAFKIYHLDLYRIHDPEELYFMGFGDLLQDKAIFLIEWPERLAGMGIVPDLTVQLALDPENEHARQLTVRPHHA